MKVRVRCPRCGKVDEYEPVEEDAEEIKEKGLSHVAFYHGDHVLVAYFDSEGSVRRALVFKSAGPAGGPEGLGMTIQDLRSLMGDEGLALALAALTSGAGVVLASSDPSLAREASSGLGRLVPGARISAAEGPEELLRALGKPGSVVIASRRAIEEARPKLGKAVLLDLDSEVGVRLGRKEKKALRALVKIIEEATGLRSEGSRVAFFRSKLGRLRGLFRKASAALGEQLSKKDVRAAVRDLTGTDKEEFDLLCFMLERFGSKYPGRAGPPA